METEMMQKEQQDTASPANESGLFRHGKVSYMQIPAVDTRQLAAFYEKVFGWTLRGGSADHFSFSDATEELIGAFVTGREISREPGVLPYVYVARIDETVALITASGGEIVREPYPEGDLWVATFRDPAGNVMGVWQHGPR
jgi:predicted enzyme related to lactoylglutathione lyase